MSSDEPLAMARLEMMREGVEECEARIFIEKALAEAKGRLPEELSERAQALLDERTRLLRLVNMVTHGTEVWYPGSPWQERAEKLYTMAAEVAEALDTR